MQSTRESTDESGWPINRNLFGDVEGGGAVRMLPAAAEQLAQDGIVRFFQSFRLLVESREVPLDHGFHAGERVILQHGPVSSATTTTTASVLKHISEIIIVRIPLALSQQQKRGSELE